MNSKKQQILNAFANFDIDMLEILLDEKYTYMDTTKDIFIAELRKSSAEILQDTSITKDFKPYKGICTGCKFDATGYTFINSQKISSFEMVFSEDENDFTDIYQCNKFKCYSMSKKRSCADIEINEDDKVDYVPTPKDLRHEKAAVKAVAIFKEQVQNEVVLKASFYSAWYKENFTLSNIEKIFTGKSYRYKEEVSDYLSKITTVDNFYNHNATCKKLYEEFVDYSVTDEEHIIEWMTKVHQEMKLFYADLPQYSIDFKNKLFYIFGFAFDFSEIQYYIYLCWIYKNYEKKYQQIVFEKIAVFENDEDDEEFPY